MKRIRVSEFNRKFTRFPHYRPGSIYGDLLILPFSTFDPICNDPLIFYLDQNDYLPEFQLIAARSVSNPTSGIVMTVARIPYHTSTPPHLTLVSDRVPK